MRITEGANTLAEAAENITMVSIYAKLGKRGRAYLDSRQATNFLSFIDALQGFHAAEGGYPKEDGYTVKESRQQTTTICFTCGKPGHRAADCWSNQKMMPPSKTQIPPQQQPTCFACEKKRPQKPRLSR